MEWIIENRAWLFDGVLVAVPLAIIGWLISRRAGQGSARRMRQRGGPGSFNLQAGRDVRIDLDGGEK